MKENVDYVEDLQGSQVAVGDTIAYAAIDGRSANLRIGTVIEIVPKHMKYDRWDADRKYGTEVPTKIRVDVSKSAFSSIEKPALIQASFKRFVKLETTP
jgi:hypothetical protein